MTRFKPFPTPEPTADDLAAIEGEMPLIEAEVLLLDAQIAIVTSDGHPSDLDWQRIRRAQRRVLREARALIDSSRTDRAA
ncbi:DUF6284 family protein [Micromonospora sp. WMMD718]|uniref:DUF6284 family protein n=1 Tax=unclassified Micromonospora TaxID=2617518 RepID=UPI00064BD992|nr:MULTISPECIES: DUF6284 family protein [unclassified Micromonospora]MDG4753787.1 DUF6284 family protein [Micromonospora sp. WMMD718]